MVDFKVDDRVRLIENVGDGCLARIGDLGTIRVIDQAVDSDPGILIGIEWDEDIHGHDLDGLCEYGHGWWVYPGDIEAANEETFLLPLADPEMDLFLESLIKN